MVCTDAGHPSKFAEAADSASVSSVCITAELRTQAPSRLLATRRPAMPPWCAADLMIQTCRSSLCQHTHLSTPESRLLSRCIIAKASLPLSAHAA